MFDVAWTDPSRETVGERRARKESKEQNADDLRKVCSSSRSFTSNGSHSQNRPSLFALFGAVGTINHGKKGLRRSGSHSKLFTTLPDDRHENSKHRISSYTIQTSISEPESTTNTTSLTNFFDVKPFLERHDPDAQEETQSAASDGEGTCCC